MVQQIFLFLRRAHHYKIIQGPVQIFQMTLGSDKHREWSKLWCHQFRTMFLKKRGKKAEAPTEQSSFVFVSLRHCLFWLSDKKKIRLHHHNFHIISETHHRSQFSYHLISTQPRVKKYERPSVIVPEAEWSNRLSNQD